LEVTPVPVYVPPVGVPPVSVNGVAFTQTGCRVENATTGNGFTVIGDTAVSAQPPLEYTYEIWNVPIPEMDGLKVVPPVTPVP
jgi:hypothetical protein